MQAFSLNLPLLKISFELHLRGHIPHGKKKGSKEAILPLFCFLSDVLFFGLVSLFYLGLAWRSFAIWRHDFLGQGDILKAIAGMQPELHRDSC